MSLALARILIAEDANFSRAVLSKTLRAAGHEVLEATDGLQCLTMLMASRPDCLILDLLMPELTGYQVLATLRERQLDVPAIVVTADVQATSRQRCLELGAIAVINKPPAPEILQAALSQALGQ